MIDVKSHWTYLACAKCLKEVKTNIDTNLVKVLPEGWVINKDMIMRGDKELKTAICPGCQ